jgi:4a-hydroxytetrahydrobiopterin dehydratase
MRSTGRGHIDQPGGVALMVPEAHDGHMADPKKTLTASEISEAAPAGWTLDGEQLTARFATGDFATGLALVDRIGASAEEANHHPDIVLTYPEVTVTLSSHDVGGITSRDIELARVASGHAEALGVAVGEG